MEFLKIHDFSCGYKDNFQLDSINLNLEKGSFAGIIGPNGSGKSTFFKGITGELKATKGGIYLNGKNLASYSLPEKSKYLSVVSQFMELSPITVEEYVLMGRMPYRKPFQFFDTPEDKDIALHYLNLTGIVHLKNKRITELSGGEQQMAGIACALTQTPELLLLDEPTSHLDITHQVRIMNLLQKLNEEQGLSVLMIIHDLNLAGEYCNHLSLMKEGRIIHQGTPAEVLTYEHIEKVYHAVVVVQNNPISDKPVIFPVSERRLKEFKNKTAYDVKTNP